MTQEWVTKAEGDAKVAAALWQMDAPVYDAICFHAQQCVEKYCKAWLVERSINFPRTHDLEALAKLCLPSLAELAMLLDELRFLTSFAVEIRYPGTFASRQDAERCWQSASRVRVLLRKHLGLESAPETRVETGDHSDECSSSDTT
jgi:HEPN domain-containing protein